MRSNRKTRLHGLAIDFENNSITGESTVHEIYGILNILHTSDTIGKNLLKKQHHVDDQADNYLQCVHYHQKLSFYL